MPQDERGGAKVSRTPVELGARIGMAESRAGQPEELAVFEVPTSPGVVAPRLEPDSVRPGGG
jgi:hypothetical protein